ncbi:MAG: Flp family type IVb pilin [Alphaproteobacteria bacterium]|nr:Flp family type IVb pilin [Alphaproteobacteria bacterium]
MALRSPVTALRTFAVDRRGVTAIEYGLIAACIAVAVVAAVVLFADDVGNLFETASDATGQVAGG